MTSLLFRPQRSFGRKHSCGETKLAEENYHHYRCSSGNHHNDRTNCCPQDSWIDRQDAVVSLVVEASADRVTGWRGLKQIVDLIRRLTFGCELSLISFVARRLSFVARRLSRTAGTSIVLTIALTLVRQTHNSRGAADWRERYSHDRARIAAAHVLKRRHGSEDVAQISNLRESGGILPETCRTLERTWSPSHC